MKLLKIILAVIVLLTGLLTLNACQTLASPLEDYTWVLTLRGEPGNMKSPLPDTEVTAFFDSKEKKVRGNGGCNAYGGSYEVDGLNLSITGSLMMTEMWCGDEKGEQESQFLKALQAAESFELDHGNLIIYCGKQTLHFSRKK
jgi:heat shock protein HslJ